MTEGGHADVLSTVVRAFVGEIVLVFRINERIAAHIHLTMVLVVLSVLFKSPKATRRRNLSLCKVKVMRMELALERDLGRELECGGLQSDFISSCIIRRAFKNC